MKALDLLAPPPWQIFSLCVSACGEFFSLHSLSLSFSLHFCFIVSFVSARCSFSAPFLRCSNIFQPCHPFEESTTTCHPPRSWTRRSRVCLLFLPLSRYDTMRYDRSRSRETSRRKLHNLSGDERQEAKVGNRREKKKEKKEGEIFASFTCIAF